MRNETLESVAVAIRFIVAVLFTPILLPHFLYCGIRETLAISPPGMYYYMRDWTHPLNTWWYKALALHTTRYV